MAYATPNPSMQSVPMTTYATPIPGPQSAFTTTQEELPWGGGCPWQSDKTAFKTWVRAAMENPAGRERKELYGFLCECFMDSDNDRDGLISFEDFDFLIEDAAALPRRFGMAPSWPEMYGNEVQRKARRQQMFQSMDKHRRGAIGMEEWVAFAMEHIAGKVRAMDPNTVDFAHLSRVSPDAFVQYCDVATTNKHSEQYKSLYEHLFKVFVESDVEEKGKVHFENFDRLIEDAAKAPRDVGLAPQTHQAYRNEAEKQATRRREFQAMDFSHSNEITFDNFLRWAVDHIAEKVRDYKMGKRWNAATCSYTGGTGGTNMPMSPYQTPRQVSMPTTMGAPMMAPSPMTTVASSPGTYQSTPMPMGSPQQNFRMASPQPGSTTCPISGATGGVGGCPMAGFMRR